MFLKSLSQSVPMSAAQVCIQTNKGEVGTLISLLSLFHLLFLKNGDHHFIVCGIFVFQQMIYEPFQSKSHWQSK